jgi:hypothetical protein
MADIFISHSGGDSEVAAAIGDRLRREWPSWSLFYDKDNIRAGQRWQERLREGLKTQPTLQSVRLDLGEILSVYPDAPLLERHRA